MINQDDEYENRLKKTEGWLFLLPFPTKEGFPTSASVELGTLACFPLSTVIFCIFMDSTVLTVIIFLPVFAQGGYGRMLYKINISFVWYFQNMALMVYMWLKTIPTTSMRGPTANTVTFPSCLTLTYISCHDPKHTCALTQTIEIQVS